MPNPPMRVTAGFTQDASWQPLGLLGTPNPLYYSELYDDFEYWLAGRYTETITTAGTIAGTPGDGGQVALTTNGTTPLATDIASLQSNNANLVLSSTARWAFLTRVQLSDALNAAMIVGLLEATATPFAPTDGVFFSKPSGTTVPNIVVMSGGVTQASVAVPVTLVSGQWLDLGFTYDGKSDLLVFAGQNLVGQKADQNRVTLGPVARIPSVGSLVLSAAVLTQTLSVQSGTASSKTMLADFFYSAKER